MAKARAVEFLVDRSFSMAACEVEDAFGIGLACIEDYGNTLSWWGKATRSLTRSLTTPINDDVQFGMRFFPNYVDDACMVSAMPDVPITSSSELNIIGGILSSLPTGGLLAGSGGTPLVGALEQVSRNPGKLVDPNTTSAVILISDGANNCDNIAPADAITRLGAAAKSLHDRGVKVYAVRFGPKDATLPEQDAQLRAIVTNGGTATMDPADPSKPPYLDAPDQKDLDAVLTTVSEQLATCDFTVSSADMKADKSKVNLYINGEAIAFDSMNAKSDGWGWLDAEKTTITMYGNACKRFKNSRSTSVVVEFGCMPEVIVPLL
jgi:hypothetical protein